MTSHLLAAAATIGLLGAGIAGASDTRSFEAMTGTAAMFGAAGDLGGTGAGAAAGQCRVDVVRTGASGSSDISRQDFSDGSCVCTVVTGPAGNNGSAEATVEALLRDRTCAASPAAAAASEGGMGAGAVVGVLFGVGALVAAAASGGGGGGSDSPG